MSRLFVISDIHGHGYLLERLLDEAGYHSSKDRLYLLGDYVNKGPDSIGTLDLVERLRVSGAVALQGNNERKWLMQSPAESCSTPEAEERSRHMIAAFPLWAEYGSFLFVHAGMRPGIALERQTPEDLTTIREPFLHSPAIPGRTIVFGHTPTFRLGAMKGEVWFGEGKLGIDTGAGHGGNLSLIELEEGWQWSIPVAEPSPGIATKRLSSMQIE